MILDLIVMGIGNSFLTKIGKVTGMCREYLSNFMTTLVIIVAVCYNRSYSTSFLHAIYVKHSSAFIYSLACVTSPGPIPKHYLHIV
jgi:hypothetical protein